MFAGNDGSVDTIIYSRHENWYLYSARANQVSSSHGAFPANTTPWINAVLMLVQRRRRWANNKPALVQGVVLAGFSPSAVD